jgi:hypothetical protein
LRFPAQAAVAAVPVDSVSRLQFAEVAAAVAARIDPQRTGAWLHNGDFLEGDFQGMDAREIRLGSVLFGNRTIERDRVVAVVLRPLTPKPRPWRVSLRDGSTLRLDQLPLDAGTLTLKASPFSGLRIPASSISEVRWEP